METELCASPILGLILENERTNLSTWRLNRSKYGISLCVYVRPHLFSTSVFGSRSLAEQKENEYKRCLFILPPSSFDCLSTSRASSSVNRGNVSLRHAQNCYTTRYGTHPMQNHRSYRENARPEIKCHCVLVLVLPFCRQYGRRNTIYLSPALLQSTAQWNPHT